MKGHILAEGQLMGTFKVQALILNFSTRQACPR
jgi:hypothetical protein